MRAIGLRKAYLHKERNDLRCGEESAATVASKGSPRVTESTNLTREYSERRTVPDGTVRL